jgi:RNA polymerase sigma factor (sigma-70 family)
MCRIALRDEPAACYRLSPWDTDDVIQATWLQFIQHGRDLRRPTAIRGWLVTTARRQSLRVSRQYARERPTDDPVRGRPSPERGPEQALLAAERNGVLQAAVAELPDRQHTLMDVLVARPDLSYAQVGRLLAMPIGSLNRRSSHGCNSCHPHVSMPTSRRRPPLPRRTSSAPAPVIEVGFGQCECFVDA